MELFLELSTYAFYSILAMMYFFICLIIYATESNHIVFKVARCFTLPLMFLPILVLLFISGCMIVKDYVHTGSQAFKR